MKKLLIGLILLWSFVPMMTLANNLELSPEEKTALREQAEDTCRFLEQQGAELPPECDDFVYRPPTKEYTIPFLPKPDGVPGFEAENREDPEEARQYFLRTLLPRVTQVLIGLIAVASFVVLLYAGTLYFTTFGDEDQAGKAKNAALYAIVGLIVALLSFAIVQLISSLPFQ